MNKYEITALQYHNTMGRKKKYNEPVNISVYVSINICCIIQQKLISNSFSYPSLCVHNTVSIVHCSRCTDRWVDVERW